MSTENTIEDLKNRTPGGFGVTVETLKPTEQDIRVLSAQLGRKVRDVVEIPARCVCGNPLVAATAPRLARGSLNTDFDAPAPSPVTARAHNR